MSERWYVKLLTGDEFTVAGSPYFDGSAGVVRFRNDGRTVAFYNIGALAFAELDLPTEDDTSGNEENTRG